MGEERKGQSEKRWKEQRQSERREAREMSEKREEGDSEKWRDIARRDGGTV